MVGTLLLLNVFVLPEVDRLDNTEVEDLLELGVATDGNVAVVLKHDGPVILDSVDGLGECGG